MTESPGTSRLRSATISGAAAMIAWSGSGMRIEGLLAAARVGPGGTDGNEKPRPRRRGPAGTGGQAAPVRRRRSALARLEARVGLVDDVDPPLAPDDAAILVAQLCRFHRVDDLHDTGSHARRGADHRQKAPLCPSDPNSNHQLM